MKKTTYNCINGICKIKPVYTHRSPVKSRRRSRRKSRPPVKSRRRSRSYMTLARCKSALNDKIKINMREYNEGKYANRKQAIAIAYSQINKKYPQCKGKI
jgi:hypothetical protein